MQGCMFLRVAQVSRAVCFYEWQKYTTLMDKLSAASWFATLLDGSSTCIEDHDSRKKKQKFLCTRWDRGQLGQNGVIDEEDVEGDDMGGSEADDANRNDRR